MAAPSETIFALSSAPGKAGVAVVRVSGSDAWTSYKLFTNANEAPLPRIALFRKLLHPDTHILIDKALVIPFQSPASFTGEDIVEYHLHGGAAVVEAFLSALRNQPHHRLAEPGEFTRRAFENGKLDLTEAEAVGDLINAETEAQRLQALSQMEGGLSKLYNGWRTELVRALAYVEAVIDFPDEDVPDSETSKAIPAIQKIAAELSEHLNDNHRGERLRNGIQVAVIGAPNAGKSSLVNALAKRDVAIVSPMAGTTRDVIEVHLDLGGYPVILADTAGLRPDQITEDGAHGSIESEGIRRALQRAHDADIRVLVFDGTDEKLDEHTLALLDENSIPLLNKCDSPLYHHPREGGGPDARLRGHGMVEISILSEKNLAAFLDTLTTKIKSLYAVSRETPSLTRARHRAALEDCFDHLMASQNPKPPELMAEDLRLATRGLGRITGRVDVEDLLDVIFRDFCIGK